MKLTPEEIDVFKNLSNSEVGAFLVSYMKRVQDFCYDCRNWEEGMTPDAAKLAAKVIQDAVIDKIRPHKATRNELNPHE